MKLPHRMVPRSAYRADVGSRIGVERDAQGRVWCQLFPLGTWHRSDFPGGSLELTGGLFAQFIANWKAGGSPSLPVDYNHDEDGPASGWIEDLRIGPTGCLEGATKWNPRAEAEIKADERRYLSPTWAMQHVNRTSGEKGGPWLYGAALLNDPFFDSMPRVAATAGAETTHPTTKEQDMDKKRICAALGFPEDCDDEELMAALEAKCKATASAGEVEAKLTAAVKASSDIEAKLTAANVELGALRAERHAEQVSALVASGKAEGKALDALVPLLAGKSLDEAKALVAAFPVTVPVVTSGIVGAPAAQPEDSRAKFNALVDEKVKAGMKGTEAMKLTSREHPALAAVVFPTTTSTASGR